MGRPRIVLKTLGNEYLKIYNFTHQRSMIIEKVRDLSILTGADVLFLAFAPSGPPFICLGENTEFSEIIRRFRDQPCQERELRKNKNLETLRINLISQGRGIDIEPLSIGWKRKRMDELNEELRKQKAKLSELGVKSSLLANPTNINNIEHIEEMAEPLRKSIDGLRKRKDHLDKLRQETQNEEAADEQIPVQLPQSPHHGAIYQGINENSNQPMLQGNVESSRLPTMNTQNVEPSPELNYQQDPIQQSNHDLDSYTYNNFGFGSDLVTMKTQNVESGPELNYQQNPIQHSNHYLDSYTYNNFGFGSDLVSDGLNFDFLQQELENFCPYSFGSILQSNGAGPSNVDKSSSPHL